MKRVSQYSLMLLRCFFLSVVKASGRGFESRKGQMFAWWAQSSGPESWCYVSQCLWKSLVPCKTRMPIPYLKPWKLVCCLLHIYIHCHFPFFLLQRLVLRRLLSGMVQHNPHGLRLLTPHQLRHTDGRPRRQSEWQARDGAAPAHVYRLWDIRCGAVCCYHCVPLLQEYEGRIGK